MGILLLGGAVVSSWSSESLSVSLKNIGPFFKNFPEIGKEENQEKIKEFRQCCSLYMDCFLRIVRLSLFLNHTHLGARNSKALSIEKTCPGRRVTHIPELPWASESFLHLHTKLGEPFTWEAKKKVTGHPIPMAGSPSWPGQLFSFSILCTYWPSGRAGRENIWLEVWRSEPTSLSTLF